MNRITTIILFLISFLSFPTFAQDNLIKMDAKEIPLVTVLKYLETNHGFLFSYRESDIQNLNVTPFNQASTINIFLEKTLNSTDLEFEIIQKNYIALSKKDATLGQSQPPSKTSKELCGRVIDKFSKEPLHFANVYLPRTQKGASTSKDGSFSFKTEIENKDSVTISYVGFQEKKVAASDLLKQPCLEVELDYYEFSDNLIVVKEYLTDGVELNDNRTFTKIKPNRIGALPGQAEPDVLKTIQFLPGISSPNQSAGSINIRGGTSDQNLILWEEIPIYHSAHYFGTVSAFNPYIIDEAKVYRGGFNADYGGRVSGIIDMKSSNNTNGKNNFTVGTNFLNAYANGKLNLIENKVSVIFSLRRSIADIWRSPTFEDLTQRINQGVLYQLPNFNTSYPNINFKNQFKFLDSNLKFNYQPSVKDKISSAFLYGNNDFDSTIKDDVANKEQKDDLYLFNRGISLSWMRSWSPNFSTKISAVYSKFRYDYDYSIKGMSQNERDISGEKVSQICERQIHFSNTYKFPFNHTLKTGYQLTDYDVDYSITRSLRNTKRTDQNRRNLSLLHVVYGTWDTDPTKKIGAKLGLRSSYYEEEDEVFFEPRLQLWYNLTDNFNLYLNTGKYYQFLSQLIEIEGDRSSIETPVWVMTGNKEVPILDAEQHQIGFLYKKNNWIVDFQAYYKNIDGLTSLATGFDTDFSDQFQIGKAKIKGIDLLVKKRINNYRSWISYSLSKVDHEFKTFFDANFLGPNDQRHALNWVNMMKWKNWEFSLGWKITSGRPYSQRENYRITIEQSGMMDQEENIEPIVKEFNSEILSPIHHIDASVMYSYSAEKWKGIFGLSIYNMYNQRNRYQRGFFIKDNPGNLPELTYSDKVDVGFMPNFVARIEF